MNETTDVDVDLVAVWFGGPVEGLEMHGAQGEGEAHVNQSVN